MDLLKAGLYPPVVQMMRSRYGETWWDQYRSQYPHIRAATAEELDVQGLLHIMRNNWRDGFGATLGNMERNLVHELIEARNLWAHQQPFSTDDTERALDSMARLLRAVSASEQADEIERERQNVRRTQYAEFARTETRKKTSATVATQATGGLRPWREIITPHRDVQKGNFQQAEFAADLAQVARGEGTPEYTDPVEFFRRTYLTDGLSTLLKNALLRLAGKGGDPVVELQTNFGRLSAARRVARTLFLGSAPTYHVANRGIEDRDIKLGCAQPGESIATFGDALRTLSDRATQLYQDGRKYWFSTQPSVTRTARERADASKQDEVYEEVARRLRQQSQRGDFVRVHACPASSADVRDEPTIGLVILGPEHQHTRHAEDSPAMTQARQVLDQRGDSPRLNRNTLVFAAADKAKWIDLEAAVRQFLAWDSIFKEREPLNLDAFQRNQAETKQKDTNTTVGSRLADTYQWILFPRQESPQGRSVEWDELRTLGEGELAQRVGQRLRNHGVLHTRWNGVSLKQWLDRVPLWRGDAVAIRELASFFAQYLYLDKLRNDQVLLEAIADGLNNSMWMTETFALADAVDAATVRYLGLIHGQYRLPTLDQLLVKPEVAERQIQRDQREADEREGRERPPTDGTDSTGTGTGTDDTGRRPPPPPPLPPVDRAPRRYYAQVRLNPEQIATETGKLSAEVLQHLVGVLGANVTVTLEIEAVAPAGFTETVRRTVDENSRTLKFEQHGFEDA